MNSTWRDGKGSDDVVVCGCCVATQVSSSEDDELASSEEEGSDSKEKISASAGRPQDPNSINFVEDGA